MKKLCVILLSVPFILWSQGCNHSLTSEIKQKAVKINGNASQLYSDTEDTTAKAKLTDVMRWSDEICDLSNTLSKDSKSLQARVDKLTKENSDLKKKLEAYNKKIYAALITMSILGIAVGVATFFFFKPKTGIAIIAAAILLGGITLFFQRFEMWIMCIGGAFIVLVVAYMCFLAYKNMKADVHFVSLIQDLRSKLDPKTSKEIFGEKPVIGSVTKIETPYVRNIVSTVKKKLEKTQRVA